MKPNLNQFDSWNALLSFNRSNSLDIFSENCYLKSYMMFGIFSLYLLLLGPYYQYTKFFTSKILTSLNLIIESTP